MSTQEAKPTRVGSDKPKSRSFSIRPGNLVLNLTLVAVVVASALWLPPFSLSKRFVEGGYTNLGQGVWSVSDPDGTQFTVLPEGLRAPFKAKLSSVPRSEFMEGKGDTNLVPAAQNVPSFLDIKSPLYRLAFRGESPAASLLSIPIPNDAQPYETLDVYAWDGSGWSWLPSQVIGSEDLILAELGTVPEDLRFVVAQTRQLPPVISADLTGGAVPEAANGVVVELNPRLFALGDNGQVKALSSLEISPGASFALVPILSNVDEQGTIRNDLVDNLLADQQTQQAHIAAIVDALTTGPLSDVLQGIELDYRAVNPALRSAFSEFVAALAEQLHQHNKILTVRVETPRQIAQDQWDSGAFDWRALGRAVDGIKVPCLPDPQAYVDEGKMEQLLRWAVGQVNRQQLQFVLSTRSVDLKGPNPAFVSYAEAMKPFTQVATEDGRESFKAGEQVILTLSAGEGSTNVMYDEGCKTYWYRYRDERGEDHTVWLQNAASIAHKLQLFALYNLRGVAFQHLLEDGNDGQVWQVVSEFHTRTVPQMSDQFAVVWTIYDRSGKSVENLTTPLRDPRLVWVAPQDAGEYRVMAALSSDGGSTTTAQGETLVQVARELPTPTPTMEPTAEPTPTAEPSQEPTPAPTQAVAQANPDMATVTSDVLNLRMGPGTDYTSVGQVRQGDKLKILGKNPQGTWLKVAAPNGTEAWVILTYVKVTKSMSDIPLAEVPPTPTPAPQPTRSPGTPAGPPPRNTAFGYGVQAHAHNGLDRVVNAINDMGFGWLKQQVRWEETEGRKGDYGWGGLDRIADACQARGVKVLFSVVAAPGWTRGGKSGVGPPDNYQDFYNFMGAMAAHFKGRVHAYEIWNEQNLKREWEGAPLSAADYVRLLRGAYQAIKAADPNALVISGAPTPTGISDGNWAIDYRTYLQQMYNAGLRSVCDGVGAHPSGYANPPTVYYRGGDFDPSRGFDDHPSFFFQNTMVDYYNIMAANGDGGKRIWATEFGWPTVDGMGVGPSPGYEFAANLTEAQQAQYLVDAYTWSRNWGHAGIMFLWNLNFWPVAGAENEMAKYGIVRGDWSPRPAYTALKNMPK